MGHSAACPQGEVYNAKGREENCELFSLDLIERISVPEQPCPYLWFSGEEVKASPHPVDHLLYIISRNNFNSPGCAIIFAVPQVCFGQLWETKLILQAPKFTGKISVMLRSL